MDLRERVAKAQGTGSSYAVADRFSVTDSWSPKDLDPRTDPQGRWHRFHAEATGARKVDAEGEGLDSVDGSASSRT